MLMLMLMHMLTCPTLCIQPQVRIDRQDFSTSFRPALQASSLTTKSLHLLSGLQVLVDTTGTCVFESGCDVGWSIQDAISKTFKHVPAL